MTKYELIHGKSQEKLPLLGKQSIHSVVTSPPYWDQRDYGEKDQLGAESTVEEYLANLCNVFDEVKNVLRDDGTAWVNLGDCMRDGSLVSIPFLFTEEMKRRGWYYRQYFPWLKRNAIPRGGNIRPNDSLECILMFSKAKSDYYYDQLSAKEQAGLTTRNFRNGDSILLEPDPDFWVFDVLTRKNWSQHFSTFPPLLAEIMVRASTSDGGCCSRCGVQAIREVQKNRYATRAGTKSKVDSSGKAFRDKGRHVTEYKHLSWKFPCSCQTRQVVQPIVLDPFSGLATVGIACINHSRFYKAIEINEEYLGESDARLSKHSPTDVFVEILEDDVIQD
jgi:hypothetical protein